MIDFDGSMNVCETFYNDNPSLVWFGFIFILNVFFKAQYDVNNAVLTHHYMLTLVHSQHHLNV